MATGTYAYQNDYARELHAKGEAKGEAKMLLLVLNDRGIAVPAEARERIESCGDSDMLRMWMHRALRATTVDDVLDAS